MTNAMRAIAALALTAGVAVVGGSTSLGSTTTSTAIGSTTPTGTITSHISHNGGGNSSTANGTLLDADHLPLQLTTAKVDLDIEIDIQLLTNGYDGTTVSEFLSSAGDGCGQARMWARTGRSIEAFIGLWLYVSGAARKIRCTAEKLDTINQGFALRF